MSQEKAQLIAPQGHFTVPGLNVAGVVTASSFSGNCTGTASSIAQGTNVVVGVMTASSFAGDVFGNAAGLSTTTAGLKLGIVTATSFAGNFTGIGSGLTGTPNIVAGLVTATQFIGNTPGLAAGISAGKNLAAGIVTATTFHGDGSNLTGAGSTAFIRQTVGSGATINLNDGNIVNLLHITDSTVSFANTSTADDVTIIRPLDLASNGFTSGAVTFDETGDYLTVGSSADFTMGTGDFTIECWVKFSSAPMNNGIFQISNTAGGITDSNFYDGISVWSGGGGSHTFRSTAAGGSVDSEFTSAVGQFFHVALVRASSVTKLYINGSSVSSTSDTTDYSGTYIAIGGYWSTDYLLDGLISNFRVVKGTAVYTNNFTPPLADLTNVTNTKLLCCQDTSSTTVGAVKPGTITANGDPTAASTSIYPSLHSTLTWPDSITWNGGSAPTLLGANNYSLTGQVFNLVTADGGSTWYGYEEVNNNAGFVGELWSWGYNSYGGLAQNNTTSYSSPVQIPGTTWTHVINADLTSARKSDGTLWVWGSNVYGELGQNEGTNAHKSSPVQIPGTTWTGQLSVFNRYVYNVKSDGTLWAWGENSKGQLGQNNRTHYSSPVQIPGTTWSKVEASYTGAFGIKTDGTLWSWGDNEYGQGGHNNTTEYSSPVQIPGTTWESVGNGTVWMAMATKTDGTLWTWGYNAVGQLGINNAVQTSSPTQIPGTNWKALTPGRQGLMYVSGGALKTDGTLWTWGYNENGQLGLNNTTSYSSPMQIPGTTWEDVSAGNYAMSATKTDGTLWMWGDNEIGQLGQNSPESSRVSSPVQVPGTWSTFGFNTAKKMSFGIK